MSPLEGSAVVRSPQQLRPHPAFDELGWSGVDELNNTARLKNQSVPEPILITTNGTILAGFGLWRLAVFERRHELHCIEYPLSEDESLQCILTYQSNPARMERVCAHLSRSDTGAQPSAEGARQHERWR
jgi:hypothetical protein